MKYNHNNSDTKVYLEDRLTGEIHNFENSGDYKFYSDGNEYKTRFVLHFGTDAYLKESIDALVFANNLGAILDLTSIQSGEFTSRVFDVSGRIINRQQLNAGTKVQLKLNDHGVYVISLSGSSSKTTNFKVIY